jgi:hypothetical protein
VLLADCVWWLSVDRRLLAASVFGRMPEAMPCDRVVSLSQVVGGFTGCTWMCC